MVNDAKMAEEVFFSQNDPGDSWTYEPYWERNVKNEGCGMISLTMCIDVLTGKGLTPMDVMKMRREYGADQFHTFNRLTFSVCGGDVHPFLNNMNKKLFGVKSLPLERSVEAFKEALSRENTVIWASTSDYDLHDVNGEPYVRKPGQGHVVTIWKYEKGYFYFKDCHFLKDLGNNVPYSEDEMAAYLAARNYQQYAITLA